MQNNEYMASGNTHPETPPSPPPPRPAPNPWEYIQKGADPAKIKKW